MADSAVGSDRDFLKIGEVSRQSGISIKTIRYYEQLGLLVPTVWRSPARYRLFHPQVLQRLAFIKQAQSLGLSLKEITEILQVYDRGELPCGEIKQHLEQKLEAIDQQMAALQRLRQQLTNLLSGWQENPPPERASRTICPNIQD
ncbi:heavy metal-responsive transcriptional regulator [Geitlerinema sp. PCC 9228]|jgi:DNA-binding transcriptional MerR regulator|uniref:heavy metal-responsive transcriptional regulator n=1 Tax=Geitlerinema sp. PCC 9228 TaxID=111611 RepID=UPI0008F9D22C|nr:heavy metal-responsive transcriptional regulator [Geitlerinema sp. PCC 9228]